MVALYRAAGRMLRLAIQARRLDEPVARLTIDRLADIPIPEVVLLRAEVMLLQELDGAVLAGVWLDELLDDAREHGVSTGVFDLLALLVEIHEVTDETDFSPLRDSDDPAALALSPQPFFLVEWYSRNEFAVAETLDHVVDVLILLIDARSVEEQIA